MASTYALRSSSVIRPMSDRRKTHIEGRVGVPIVVNPKVNQRLNYYDGDYNYCDKATAEKSRYRALQAGDKLSKLEWCSLPWIHKIVIDMMASYEWRCIGQFDDENKMSLLNPFHVMKEFEFYHDELINFNSFNENYLARQFVMDYICWLNDKPQICVNATGSNVSQEMKQDHEEVEIESGGNGSDDETEHNKIIAHAYLNKLLDKRFKIGVNRKNIANIQTSRTGNKNHGIFIPLLVLEKSFMSFVGDENFICNYLTNKTNINIPNQYILTHFLSNKDGVIRRYADGVTILQCENSGCLQFCYDKKDNMLMLPKFTYWSGNNEQWKVQQKLQKRKQKKSQ